MKVLIENTVPLNNGDAALIFSLGDKLKTKGFEVVYSTTQYEIAKKLYPDEKWILAPTTYRVSKVPIIGTLFLMFYLLIHRNMYKKFDAIISAPGGYINSYYTLGNKIKLLNIYKKYLHKKVYIYSQSIGPLNDKNQQLLKKHLVNFDLIYARDDISIERLKNLGIVKNTVQTKDAAFLLERENQNKKMDTKEKKVAISVREWDFDGRSKKTYFNLITNIVTFFYNKNYKITFLSTCQGLENYRDDSVIAKEIYDSLPDEVKKKTTINDKYHNVYELRKILSNYDFVIGTRLHMCILSWLSNVPAFNISYEEKGKESYNYLGLSRYSVDYNFDKPVTDILNDFITEDFNDIYKTIDSITKESEEYLDLLIEDIQK